ncbi:MAG: glucosyl transferase, partial [Bacteroidota bacterium]
IESGTELNFYDIHGNYNYKTNKWEIIAVASHIAHSKERAIVKIENNKIESLSSEPIGWSLSSVWFIPNRKYYVVGSGIYKKNLLQNSAWNADLYNLTPYYASEILGNGLNDIFIVGACGIVFHFNGTTWREQQPVNCNHGYGNISMKDNIVAISGSNGSEGILLLGKR